MGSPPVLTPATAPGAGLGTCAHLHRDRMGSPLRTSAPRMGSPLRPSAPRMGSPLRPCAPRLGSPLRPSAPTQRVRVRVCARACARVCAFACACACACGMPRSLRASFLTCARDAFHAGDGTAEGRRRRRRTRPPLIHPRAHVCAARVATAASKEQWPADLSGTGPIVELGSAIVPGGPTAKDRWLGPPRAAVRPKSGPGARRAAAAASRSLGEFPTARALVGSRGAPRTDVTIGPARASNAPGCQPAAQRHARLGPMRSIRNWPRAAPARWGRRDRPAASGPAWPGAHRAECDSAADGVTQDRNCEGKLRSSGCRRSANAAGGQRSAAAVGGHSLSV